MNAPVVALVGQIPQADIDRGLGHLHEIHDQPGMAGTSRSLPRASRPRRTRRRILTDAFRQACSGRPGPVMVECAMDTWARTGRDRLAADAGARAAPASGPARDRVGRQDCSAQQPAAAHHRRRRRAGRQRRGDRAGRDARSARSSPIAAARASCRRRTGCTSTCRSPIASGSQADCVLAIGTRMLYPESQWGLDDEAGGRPDRYRP